MCRQKSPNPWPDMSGATGQIRLYRVRFTCRDDDGYPCTRTDRVEATNADEAVAAVRKSRGDAVLRFDRVDRIGAPDQPPPRKGWAHYVLIGLSLVMLAGLMAGQFGR